MRRSATYAKTSLPGSRATDWRDGIVVDPAILVGKPVIKDTRIAVEFVIDLLANGWSEDDIFTNYPGLAP